MLNWHIPYLTADSPGIGGVIRAEVDDFVVEEIPAYEPCGEGEHTFFLVEKRDISTMVLVGQLARALDRPEQEFGSAGLKDARSVARQMFSVHGVPPEAVTALELDKARVLWARRHTNKLRTGHLRGNHFTLRIRRVDPDAGRRAAAIVAVLEDRGVPNAYGFQRFGNAGDNHEIGLLLLRNDRAALRARRIYQLSFRMRQFYISALQSALFNRYLAERIVRGAMDDVMPGDIAKKETTGGIFTVEDVAAERPRVKAWEISPTGPIYGYKMLAAQAEAGALETEILSHAGLTTGDFRPAKAKGSRRPLRFRPKDLTWCLEGDDALVVSFFAPKGSFATMVLRELMKADAALDEDDDADAEP